MTNESDRGQHACEGYQQRGGSVGGWSRDRFAGAAPAGGGCISSAASVEEMRGAEPHMLLATLEH
jgi:hypothetical protein